MQAVLQAEIRNTVGLRYTGMGLGSCAHLEMILLLGVGNLHKGERLVHLHMISSNALANLCM